MLVKISRRRLVRFGDDGFTGREDLAGGFSEISREVDGLAVADLLAVTFQPFTGFGGAGKKEPRNWGRIVS